MYLRCTVATSTVGPRWAVHEFIYILRWRVDQSEGGTERVKNFSERMMWGGREHVGNLVVVVVVVVVARRGQVI